MTKIGTRKVLTVMLLLSMFSFMGCGFESRDEKAAKKILSSLQEKYGEEFVLDSIGGGWGTMNNNTLKAIVYPKSDETLKVKVEITKDLEEVYDKYLNKVVAKNEEPTLQAMATSIWPDSKITVANDTGLLYPEDSDTKMSFEKFHKLYPSNVLVITIYLNSENYIDSKGNMDQKSEIGKYMSLAKMLQKNRYVSSHVSIGYLTSAAYERFDELKKTEDNLSLFYMDETEKTEIINMVTMSGYSLGADGQIEESREEIEEFFDKWKENRLKSIEQRGGL